MSYGLIHQIFSIWVTIIAVLTIRGITPRYKTDVLISIVWKILIPITLFDIFIITLFV